MPGRCQFLRLIYRLFISGAHAGNLSVLHSVYQWCNAVTGNDPVLYPVYQGCAWAVLPAVYQAVRLTCSFPVYQVEQGILPTVTSTVYQWD